MATAIHPFSREEIMAYLDGELRPERAVAVAQHLEQCRECQQWAGDFRRLSEGLLSWETEPATAGPPGWIEEQRKKPGLRFWQRPWLWMASAATTIVLLGVIATHSSVHERLPRGFTPMLSRAPVQFEGIRSSSEPGISDSASVAKKSATGGGGGVIGGVIGGVMTGVAGNPPAAPAPSAVPSAAASGPLIVRTAQLTLTSRDFDRSRAEIERITAVHQGYVAQLDLNAPAGAGRALSAMLRVPASQLDSVLGELKRLGRVTEESQRGEDVTSHYVDVEARLSNLRTTEGRLLQILRERTGRLADVLQVEESVDRTRQEIEVGEAEQKALSNQITFASVQMSVLEEYKAQLNGNETATLTRLRNAAVEGYRNAVEGLIDVLVFLFSIGPVLLIAIGVLIGPTRWLWRRWQEGRLTSGGQGSTAG